MHYCPSAFTMYTRVEILTGQIFHRLVLDSANVYLMNVLEQRNVAGSWSHSCIHSLDLHSNTVLSLLSDSERTAYFCTCIMEKQGVPAKFLHQVWVMLKLTNIDTITSGCFSDVMHIFKLFALENGVKAWELSYTDLIQPCRFCRV